MSENSTEIKIPEKVPGDYRNAYQKLKTFQATLQRILGEQNESFNLNGIDRIKEAPAYADGGDTFRENSPYPLKSVRAMYAVADALLKTFEAGQTSLDKDTGGQLKTCLNYLEARTDKEWWVPYIHDATTEQAGQAMLTFLSEAPEIRELLDNNTVLRTIQFTSGWNFGKQLFEVVPKAITDRLKSYREQAQLKKKQLSEYQEKLIAYTNKKPLLELPEILKDKEALISLLPAESTSISDNAETLKSDIEKYEVLLKAITDFEQRLTNYQTKLDSYKTNITIEIPRPDHLSPKQTQLYDKTLQNAKAQLEPPISLVEIQQWRTKLQTHIKQQNRRLLELTNNWEGKLAAAREEVEHAKNNLTKVKAIDLTEAETTLVQKFNERQAFITQALNILNHLKATINEEQAWRKDESTLATSLTNLLDNKSLEDYLEIPSSVENDDKIWVLDHIIGYYFYSDYRKPGLTGFFGLYHPTHPEITIFKKDQSAEQLQRLNELQADPEFERPTKRTILNILNCRIHDLTKESQQTLASDQQFLALAQEKNDVKRLNKFNLSINQNELTVAQASLAALTYDKNLDDFNKALEQLNDFVDTVDFDDPEACIDIIIEKIDATSDILDANIGIINKELGDVTSCISRLQLHKRLNITSKTNEIKDYYSELIDRDDKVFDEDFPKLQNKMLDIRKNEELLVDRSELGSLQAIQKTFTRLLAKAKESGSKLLSQEKFDAAYHNLKTYHSELEVRQTPLIKECQRSIEEIKTQIETAIQNLATTHDLAEKENEEESKYRDARKELTTKFFKGLSPDAAKTSKLIANEGLFTRYLKHRYEQYYVQDSLNQAFSFGLQTERDRRVQYLLDLQKATEAYANAPADELEKCYQALHDLIKQGMNDALKEDKSSKGKNIKHFKPREASSIGQQHLTLQRHLETFLDTVEDIGRHHRPKPAASKNM